MEDPVLSRADARRIEALQRRKSREREGLFVAEGVRVVEELLASDTVLRHVVVSPSLEDSARGRALLEHAVERTTVLHTNDVELRRLTGTETSQGVLAVAEIPHRALNDIALSARTTVLVLDAVQDPGNLGTLIRTADAFAVAGVIALEGTVDCWNPKVVRAAAGSLFRAPVVYASADDVHDWFTANEIVGYGADAAGANVDTVTTAPRAALIVGNEGAGLGAGARALAQRSVAIPMPGHAESLNVAVAAGILLHVFTRTNQ